MEVMTDSLLPLPSSSIHVDRSFPGTEEGYHPSKDASPLEAPIIMGNDVGRIDENYERDAMEHNSNTTVSDGSLDNHDVAAETPPQMTTDSQPNQSLNVVPIEQDSITISTANKRKALSNDGKPDGNAKKKRSRYGSQPHVASEEASLSSQRRILSEEKSTQSSTLDIATAPGKLQAATSAQSQQSVHFTNDLAIEGDKASTEASPKRKRGRPRKSAGSDEGRSDHATVTKVKSGAEGSETHKRGRGRPRSVVEEGNLAADASVASSPPKKMRGRPRKEIPSFQTSLPSTRGDDSTNEDPVIGDSQSERAQPSTGLGEGETAKRGRGRPRKNETSTRTEPREEQPSKESPKRGRGRPRKISGTKAETKLAQTSQRGSLRRLLRHAEKAVQPTSSSGRSTDNVQPASHTPRVALSSDLAIKSYSHLRTFLATQGCAIVSNAFSEDFDVLVVANKELQRTSKLLWAIAQGKAVATLSWLTHSAAKDTVLDWSAYKPTKLSKQLREADFANPMKSHKSLLKGISFICTPALKKSIREDQTRREIEQVARFVGARLQWQSARTTKAEYDTNARDVFHLGLANGDIDAIALLEAGYAVYTSDLFFASIIRGRFEAGSEEFLVKK